MMRSFAETFFTRFGAKVYPLEAELVVDLPPELAATFGQPRLYLVFADQTQAEPRELSPTEDLLVYGSRTFEQMLGLLAGRGEVMQLILPGQVPLGPDDQPLFSLRLHNCRLLDSRSRTQAEPFYIFNFRAVYRSDEKQEEFITLSLDAQGRPHPATLSAVAALESFQPPSPPLSPDRETLQRLLDKAAGLARQQAEARAAELEQALQARLHKTLLRLTTFYRRLAAEVNTDDPAQAEAVHADLQRDLTRKIADELESHRLRITLTPLSYALALTPLAHYELALATRHTQQKLAVVQNLHTGQMEHFDCRHCGQPVDPLALCERGHAVCPSCLDSCHHCQHDICRACGIQACASCHKLVCRRCTAVCAYCDRWLCAAHIAACAGCGHNFCTGHALSCRCCGQTYCQQCGQSGTCQTCHLALMSEPLAAAHVPAIAGVKPERYRWGRAENRAGVIYIGRNKGLDVGSLVGGYPVIVTDSSGQVLHWRKMRSLTWWLKFLGR